MNPGNEIVAKVFADVEVCIAIKGLKEGFTMMTGSQPDAGSLRDHRCAKGSLGQRA